MSATNKAMFQDGHKEIFAFMSRFYVKQKRRNSYEFVEETRKSFAKWESLAKWLISQLFFTRDLFQDTFYAALFDTKSYYFVSTSCYKVSCKKTSTTPLWYHMYTITLICSIHTYGINEVHHDVTVQQ